MCFNSVNSRKFFFRASWFVLISFSSFSSFSKVACHSKWKCKQIGSVYPIPLSYLSLSISIKLLFNIFKCLYPQNIKLQWKFKWTNLKIDHVSWKWYFWIFTSVYDGDVGFLNLLLHKPCGKCHQHILYLIRTGYIFQHFIKRSRWKEASGLFSKDFTRRFNSLKTKYEYPYIGLFKMVHSF